MTEHSLWSCCLSDTVAYAVAITRRQTVTWDCEQNKWIMDVCLCLEYWLQFVMDNGQNKS